MKVSAEIICKNRIQAYVLQSETKSEGSSIQGEAPEGVNVVHDVAHAAHFRDDLLQ
jgi:hypothetical protein